MNLLKLTEGGWLKKLGDGPQTKYSKTKKKLPDIAEQSRLVTEKALIYNDL
jgi:hypothetical protein